MMNFKWYGQELIGSEICGYDMASFQVGREDCDGEWWSRLSGLTLYKTTLSAVVMIPSTWNKTKISEQQKIASQPELIVTPHFKRRHGDAITPTWHIKTLIIIELSISMVYNIMTHHTVTHCKCEKVVACPLLDYISHKSIEIFTSYRIPYTLKATQCYLKKSRHKMA